MLCQGERIMKAFPVANHILWYANRERSDISPLKLQKLLYFLHGWYMAVTGHELIDEPFMRWQYGPVLPSVYSALRGYGSQPINDYIKEYDANSQTWIPYFVNPAGVQQFEQVMDRVWREYGHYSAIQLSSMTHEEDTPWNRTAENEEIGNDLIRKYFANLAHHKYALS
jgi:uncharacterized phage-associated protein